MTSVDPVKTEQVAETGTIEESMGLETLACSMLLDNLHRVEKRSKSVAEDVIKIQEDLNTLESLLKKINTYTDKDGNLNVQSNKDLKDLLDKAKALGVEYQADSKGNLNKTQRNALVENLNSDIKSRTTAFGIAKGKFDGLLKEQTEVLKASNMILKTLHDIGMRILQLMRPKG